MVLKGTGNFEIKPMGEGFSPSDLIFLHTIRSTPWWIAQIEQILYGWLSLASGAGPLGSLMELWHEHERVMERQTQSTLRNSSGYKGLCKNCTVFIVIAIALTQYMNFQIM